MRRCLALGTVVCAMAAGLIGGPPRAAAANECLSSSGPEDPYRFSSIPAKLAADESLIELRMGVKNVSGALAQYKVDFFVDTYDSWNFINETVPQFLNPGDNKLFNFSWDPGSYLGHRYLLHRVWRENPTTGVWEMVDWSSEGGWPIRIVDTYDGGSTKVRSPSYFGVAFVEPGKLLSDVWVANDQTVEPPQGYGPRGAEYVEDRVEEMYHLGIHTLVVAYVEYMSKQTDGPGQQSQNWGAFYGTPSFPPSVPNISSTYQDPLFDGKYTLQPDFDVLGTILHKACTLGMKVVVGLGRGTPWINLAIASPQEMTDKANWLTTLAQDLYNRYGVNEYYADAFYGWYNTYETHNFTNGFYFYNLVAQNLDQFGPEKPMMVSPYGYPQGQGSPTLTGISGASLDTGSVDIFAYQDSIGSGYPMSGIGSRFSGYQSWHAASQKHRHIWSNTEVWRGTYPDQWTAPCSEVKQQTETERWYVSQMMENEMFHTFKGAGIPPDVPQNTNEYIPENASGLAEQWYTDYSIFWTEGQPNLYGVPALCE